MFSILYGTSFVGCIDSSVHARGSSKKDHGKALGLFKTMISLSLYLEVDGRTMYREHIDCTT
jgi:hypothetical protein